MRSGATSTPPAAPQAAPAKPVVAPAATSAAKPADDMEARLRAMNLPEEAIQAALKAAAAKAAPATTPAVQPPPKPTTPPPQAPKPTPPAAPAVVKPVTPPPAAKPTPPPVIEQPAIDLEPDAVAPGDAVQVDETGTATEGMSDAEYAVYMAQQADQPTPPTQTAGAAPAASDDAAGDDGEHEESRVVVQNHWSEKSKGALSGAIDRSDFKTPQLKIIQGQGDNAAKYGQGKTVFTDMVVFDAPTSDKPSPFMRFVPVSLQKYFRENVEKNSKQKPRNASTPEEVTKLGGSLEWTVNSKGERAKPTWSPAAKLTLLLEQPEGSDHPGFTMPLDINGKISNWAAAVTYVNGGAYRSMAKPIIDATNFLLVEGDLIVLHKRIWKLQIVTEKSGENWVFSPKVAMTNEATPADLRTISESLLGGTR